MRPNHRQQDDEQAAAERRELPRPQPGGVHPPLRVDAAAIARRCAEPAPAPPPEKPPLQELALLVPTVVRRELANDALEQLDAPDGYDVNAQQLVLHILQEGVQAFIQHQQHVIAAGEQEAGVEEAYAAEEQEDILTGDGPGVGEKWPIFAKGELRLCGPPSSRESAMAKRGFQRGWDAAVAAVAAAEKDDMERVWKALEDERDERDELQEELASRETLEGDEPILENWEALPEKYRKGEVDSSMGIIKWFAYWWDSNPGSRDDLIDRAEYLIAQIGNGSIQAYRDLGYRPRARAASK